MAKDAVVEILDSDLAEHPAAVAWCRVAPRSGAPNKITILKEKGHSRVYRLDGVGPNGTAVIAKLCRPGVSAIERRIYEDILPSLPVTALRLYGVLEENGHAGEPTCWLFIEDAGDEQYSRLLDEHRALAGRWLGTLQTFTARLHALAGLPDRSPNFYLGELRALREAILHSLAYPTLTADDLATLEAILAQCEVLESHWGEIDRFCDRMPRTLVHGDLAMKNTRIRATPAGNSLVVMDWETAGWGVPAIDLAQFTGRCVSPDLATYASVLPECWPGAANLVQMAELGRIFRMIVAMSWEREGLLSTYIQRPMRRMKVYQANMAEYIRAIGWEN